MLIYIMQSEDYAVLSHATNGTIKVQACVARAN